MSDELNLSIGVSPRFFVRLEGWTDQQIDELVLAARSLNGVVKVERSAQSGMYVDYSEETTDTAAKMGVRIAASQIIPGGQFAVYL